MVPKAQKTSLEETHLQAQIDAGQLLNVASIVHHTEAEGPGVRLALWVQGCPLRCPSCCNPHMLAFEPKQLRTVRDVVQEVLAIEGIEGITLLGGEPFSQARSLATLCQEVRAAGLSVMAFTGKTLQAIQRAQHEDWDALLAQIDLLVDGPYLQKQHSTKRRWIGSDNQQIHFLTPRYEHLSASQEGWEQEGNTLEIRLVNGQIFINGFPHEDITRWLQPQGNKVP